ncbi:hypothetical protein ACDX78_09830 [Virgibacillus oceani]
MIRSFIVLLLLAVFFLSGMLYGMDQGNSAAPNSVMENHLEENESEESSFFNDEKQANTASDEMVEVAEQNNFTQQTASFLEAGVKGVYDVIVHILYQFAQIFF